MTRRLAIIGGGPRAAYALDSLARRAGHAPGALPEAIDVYEPRAELGTGMAYATDQPSWVRLNISDQALRGVRVPCNTPSDLGVPDLVVAEAREPDRYPPRAEVGRQLRTLVEDTLAALVPTVVRHLRARATGVTRSAAGFEVASVGAPPGTYDAVLLVTGHGPTWRGRLPSRLGSTPVVPALPVAGLLEAARRHRPARVVVRGASLTAIDAVLTLTEGLGGRFEGLGETTRYLPGEAVARIELLSRTGRLMDPKTESAVLARYGIEGAVNDRAIRSCLDLEPLLCASAVSALTAAWRWWGRSTGAVEEEVSRAWREVKSASPSTEDPVGAAAHRLRQAVGATPPDGRWALAQVWRMAYPALVGRQREVRAREWSSGTRTAPLAWPAYASVLPELERMAFGPPVVNAAKLLALCQAGVLSVRALGDDAMPDGADLVVDAVSIPAGVAETDDPLWTGLLADGLVRRAPYGRGIEIDSDGTCLDGAGRRIVGLAAVGRMTEDVVVGNDTLLRSMHPELERWADGVIERCADGATREAS